MFFIIYLFCSGYMSPEYAMEGVFSTKSDVYSFGVLLFEIVSGKRNNSFYTDESQLNLVGHVRLSNLLYFFNTLLLLLSLGLVY